MRTNNIEEDSSQAEGHHEGSLVFRLIEPDDNLPLAAIIRRSIEALGLPSEGTAHGDPSTDQLYELFRTEKSLYWVALQDKQILGGCGIYPTSGLPESCCELVRFFLLPEARGKGIGQQLMEKCAQSATDMHYSQMYLESFPSMEAAVHLYRKNGFFQLTAPLGNSGHYACNVWMLKNL